MAALHPARKLVRAFKDFLGLKDPGFSVAAYEMSMTMTPQEMMDFIVLFRMTMTFYTNGSLEYRDDDYANVCILALAMLDAADEADSKLNLGERIIL